MIINLIVNSIQAMYEGGNDEVEKQNENEIQISEHDNSAIMKFIDSGEGIPDDSLSKIFEPLFTTKQKGTGLDLASCKNIVEQHQGEISVSNDPTTFTIILPKILSVKHTKPKSE